MAHNPPDWLNKTFLTSVFQFLKDEKGNETEVLSFSVLSPLGAGINYASNLYRVSVDCKVGKEEKSISIIIKVPTKGGVLKEINQDHDFCAVEPKVYLELLPMMKEKLKHQFGPDVFYCPLKNGTILKDLKLDGYFMCDRFKQLNYQHCEKTFTLIAKFHAASVACYHENPNLIHEVGKEFMFTERALSNELTPWLAIGVKNILEIMKKAKDCELAANFLIERRDEMAQASVKICQPKTKGLNVLNHGDLWGNNILFKYNVSGDIEDVKLIDFQNGRYSTPVLDLLVFIWMSADNDVRENTNGLTALFKVYLETLNNTLENLECEERMSYNEMVEDLEASIGYTLANISQRLALIMSEGDEVLDLEELSIEDFMDGRPEGKLMKMYKAKHFVAIAPTVMRQYHAWISSVCNF